MKLVLAAVCALPVLALAQVADPQPEELLQLVFPQWKDEEGGRVVSIPASAVTRGWDTRQGKRRQVAVVPRQVLRVAPDRLMLLASMTPVDEGGAPQIAHGTPVGLAAYTFKPGKNGWSLAKRQEPFDLQGFEGRAQISLAQLTASTQALHVSWGSCWQGHCVDLFALYALGADGVKAQPLLLQKLNGGNVYARPDCVDRLRGIVQGLRPGDPAGANAPARPGSCYAIEGRWEVDAAASGTTPGPLTLRFTGAMSKAGKDANAPAQRIDQSMKFEYRGGRYVPVSGSNPIPDA